MADNKFQEPCGGCGEEYASKRCLGCFHEAIDWTRKVAPTLPNADELEVVAYQSDVAQLAKTIVLCCQYTWKKDRKAAYEKAERLLSAHTAAALSSAQAQIEHWRGEASRLLKSGQDALDAYETEKSRAEAAEAEVKRLREVLAVIRQIGDEE